MSYDIDLKDPVTGAVIELDGPHHMRGGTYRVGGDTRLHLNVTYNYAPHFARVLGEGGVRSLYGSTGAASIPRLEAAIAQLGDDATDRHWDATEGNAKRASTNSSPWPGCAPTASGTATDPEIPEAP